MSQVYRQVKGSHLLRVRYSHGHNYMVIVPAQDLCLELSATEASIWRLLKRAQSLDDLILLYYNVSGHFQPEFIAKLVEYWHRLGALRQIGQSDRTKSAFLWLDHLILFDLALPKFDQLINTIYRLLLQRIIEWPNFPLLLLSIWLLGLVAFLTLPATVYAQPPNWLVILAALISLALHEIGHGIAMKYVRAPILRAGFQFFLGLPVLYVDTSAAWAKRKKSRIITALGGVAMNITIAAITSLLLLFPHTSQLTGYLHILIQINLLQCLLSLIPFVQMDGYYVLIDLVGEPLLDQLAVQKVRQLLSSKHPWRKLRGKGKYYLIFFVLSLVTTAGFVVYALDFWHSLI